MIASLLAADDGARDNFVDLDVYWWHWAVLLASSS